MKIDKHSAELTERTRQLSVAIQKRDWKAARQHLQSLDRYRAVIADVIEVMEEMSAPNTETAPKEEKKSHKRTPLSELTPFGRFGSLTDYIRDNLRDLPVGEVKMVTLPEDKVGEFPLERFASAASAAACQLFGRGNYSTARRFDENGVEVMRTA